MRKKFWFIFFVIIILAGLAALIDWPSGPNFFKEIKVHQGLDLQGGVHLVYELDTSKIAPEDQDEAQSGVINVLDRRVNALGVSEPVIAATKVGDKKGVVVELPGLSNVDEALSIIGKTAELKFLEQKENEAAETGLTGAQLKKANVTFDQNGNPEVAISFNKEGADKFKEITTRNLQKPVVIALDNEIVSAPTVQSAISDGNAVITGNFNIKEAKDLALQLNSGALPVPIKIAEQRRIGPTLGQESVKRSLVAGLVGILLVGLFMILYYRLPGLLATLALLFYGLFVLALFKLIPVTLTLAGVAGFILSIGMAVDANILIFERMKEELRAGKAKREAIEDGFRRAWSSIRDSNVSSLITCLILYYGTTGLVRGFAVTLALGILVSMFTAITVSRTFLRLAWER
ncbi:protein translocase subunit SecD [Candidatus Berkelbacteria bacterium]|nr:protein translocase subunit SecD [Candidatus Berkelbacteria bacterium]